jgi:glycolate dehydrogenase FAD-linked subunit
MKFDGLKQILPEKALLLNEESRRVYECDALSAHRVMPGCVVLPDSVEQVQSILRYCHANDIPVVARGAGTGLSGGAMPHEDGVLLILAKFDQIIEIDPKQRTARVQPGVRNLAISTAAKPYGLYYAPDPSSQIACSIGGNVAENSGGVHCLKYGLTVHNILQLKVITIEGELITIGSHALDSPGYDLLALFTGSEGMLGVIVEVTVKLLPQPPYSRVLLAAFDDIKKAGNSVAAIIANGIIPAGLEMMDKAGVRAVEDYIHAGYPTEAEAILLCELDGTEEEVVASINKVKDLLNQYGAIEVRVAHDEDESQRFWAGRKAAFPAVGRISPDYYCMDGTIPRKHIAEVLSKINTFAEKYQLAVVNVFHAGDGNLHPLILYDIAIPGELKRAEAFGSDILELCISVGGTITGEHGVGVEKIREMCIQFSEHELQQFHDVKAAFDAKGLLNPGKAVPTLNRCAEFGAMHVHSGNEKFPDLERF